jgi:hypothetical protein
VYELARDGKWSTLTKLHAPEPKAGGVFGWAVAADAGTLVVGAPESTFDAQRTGEAFVFTRAAGTWQLEGKLLPPTAAEGASFGYSVAVQGDVAAVGAPHPGYPHVTHTQNSSAEPSGSVHVFRRDAGKWGPSQQLQAVVPRNGDYFGINVLLANSSLVVSASGDSSGSSGIDADPHNGSTQESGAFYVYAAGDTDWRLSNFVKSSNARRGALFAERLAVSGDLIVLSAMHDSGAATSDSGRVYVFR